MASIVVVDDDFAIEPVIDLLISKGHDVERIASAEDALNGIDRLELADVLILDVMMARPGALSETRTYGGHRTGWIIAQEVRKRKPTLPILAFTATADQAVAKWFTEQHRCMFLSKYTVHNVGQVVDAVNILLGIQESSTLLTPFIVHGHDEAAKLALKNYLQNTLGLPEPLILHEQPSGGKTIIEKLEQFASQSDLAFILLTPDDMPCECDALSHDKRRARQNVIFEMGYFLGVFGRSSGRVFLLHKGPLDLPSDIAGVVYIDITGGIEASGETIRKELKNAKVI